MSCVFCGLHPLDQNLYLIRDLPEGKFSGNRNGNFVAVFRRFVYRMGRDGVGLGTGYLACVYRVVGGI